MQRVLFILSLFICSYSFGQFSGGKWTGSIKTSANGKVWTLDSVQLKFTNPKDPVILFDPFPISPGSASYVFRAKNSSSSNIGAYEMLFDSNPNGGPPNDNIWIQGWNIDSRTDNTSPSWTQRLEYKYVGNFYEYHIQWSNATNTIVDRLFSITFQDHGGVNDVSTIFGEGTFSMNGFNGGPSYWSVSPGNMVLNNFGSHQVHMSVDDVNNVINFYEDAGSGVLLFAGFGNIGIVTPGNNAELFLGTSAGTPDYAYVSANSGKDLALFSDHAIFISGGGNSGDIARISFSPPSAGVNFSPARGYIELNQGIGDMNFHVQNGGYFFNWDLGGATGMQLTTTSFLMGVPIITIASTTSVPSIRVTQGVAPSSPTNGDTYQDGTHVFMRIGGAWKQLDN